MVPLVERMGPAPVPEESSKTLPATTLAAVKQLFPLASQYCVPPMLPFTSSINCPPVPESGVASPIPT